LLLLLLVPPTACNELLPLLLARLWKLDELLLLLVKPARLLLDALQHCSSCRKQRPLPLEKLIWIGCAVLVLRGSFVVCLLWKTIRGA
jgi:hypothetical protein